MRHVDEDDKARYEAMTPAELSLHIEDQQGMALDAIQMALKNEDIPRSEIITDYFEFVHEMQELLTAKLS